MFIQRAALALLIGVVVSSSAHAEVIDGGVSAQQRNGDWSSLRLKLERSTFGRAVVFASNGNTLALDYAVGSDCIIPTLSVLIPLGAEVEESSSTPYSGFFRVDQKPSMAFSGTLSKSTGDNTGILVVDKVGDVISFLLSLTEGRTLRLQIGEGTSDVTEKFSLSGARQAMVRAMEICGTR
jgi:hypothetical protein